MASKSDYYQATESGVAQIGPETVGFRKGEIFHKSHVLLKGKKLRDQCFKPAVSLGRGDVEAATAAPGEKRGTPEKKKKKATPAPKPKPKAKAKK